MREGRGATGDGDAPPAFCPAGLFRMLSAWDLCGHLLEHYLQNSGGHCYLA